MSLALKFAPAILSVIAFGLVSCSPEATKQFVKPHLEKTQVVQDPNVQYFDPTVDVLFVIDNSGSMNTHQARLASNIALFTEKFVKNSFLNYNIGVISTDGNCVEGGSQCVYPGGKLIGRQFKVVNKNTPNFNQVLAENLRVGITGSGYEQSFQPVVMGLSPATLAGPNAGFYRSGATLAVIFITDAEDQSLVSAPAFHEALMKMKGNDARLLLAYGVVVPTGVGDCPRDPAPDGFSPGPPPTRIEQFLGMVKNGKNQENVFNLCDPEYGQKLAGLAKDIVDNVGAIFYLDQTPDINTIRVTYGTSVLPMDPHKGWMFDVAKNAVVLGDNIDWTSQPSGSRVMVNYELAINDTNNK
jgi:hypothetical protein